MKKLQTLIVILVLVVMVVAIDQVRMNLVSEDGTSISSDSVYDDSAELAEEAVFPHDQVVNANIDIDEDKYEEMLENAMNEEYVLADLTYNGYTFYNIAIRPKGNSSLRDVAQSDSTRYSYKIDFDKYIDGQNFFGITKLNLNNLFSDDSLMAEYLGYEMLDEMDAVASNTTYVSLSINGEYVGLYLAVEAVDETFLMNNFGNYDGTLYKPDMGVGSDLAFVSEDAEDYTGITPQDESMSTDENFIKLVTVIDKIIENGGETEEYKLSDILNVDSFLSYLAFSTATVHMDAYQGGMYHNYYLYFNTETEKFEWITWDLNMIFNGFPNSRMTDEEATQFLIDEPVIGSLSKYPLVQAVFTNEEYIATYHDYLDELINGYLSEDNFEEKVLETYTMIESYATIDPTAFFTIDQVEAHLFDSDNEETLSLLEFIERRVENITLQLNGSIPSTNNGEGNSVSGAGSGGRGDVNMQMDKGQMPDEISENMTNGEMPPMEDVGTMDPNTEGQIPPMDEMGAVDPNVEKQVPDGNQGMRSPRPIPGNREINDENVMEADNKMPGGNRQPGAGEIGSERSAPTNLIKEYIPVIVSLLVTSGLVIYLMKRKY